MEVIYDIKKKKKDDVLLASNLQDGSKFYMRNYIVRYNVPSSVPKYIYLVVHGDYLVIYKPES